MITRVDLRAMLRRRLEDIVAPYLWDDATLNDFLSTAMAEFGSRFPAEGTLLLAVVEGETVVLLTALPAGAQPFRLRDPGGWEVRRSWGGSSGIMGDTEQGWSVWNGKLRFDRPARGGAWELDFLLPRSTPTDDVTALCTPTRRRRDRGPAGDRFRIAPTVGRAEQTRSGTGRSRFGENW